MNRVAALAAPCVRQARTITTSSARPQERVSLDKIKKLQEHYQIDDGVPVFLKGGMLDRVLFGITGALCVFGLGYSTTVIYDLAVPPQN